MSLNEFKSDSEDVLHYSTRVQHARGQRFARIGLFQQSRISELLLALLLLLFFGVLLIWPIVQIISAGFRRPSGKFTFDYVLLIFHDPVLVRGLVNAAGVALAVTTLSLVISLPLAVLSVRYEFPCRRVLSGFLLVPLILPPFVGAIGLRLVLGRFGPLTQIFGGSPVGIDWIGKFRLPGIVIVEALNLYPILLLNLQASLANIDPAWSRRRRIWERVAGGSFGRVTLPLIRPGLFAGATMVLIWSFTELGTPLIFNFYTMTPVQVFQQILEVSVEPAALCAGRRAAGGFDAAVPGRQGLRWASPATRQRPKRRSTRLRSRFDAVAKAAAASLTLLTVFLLAVVPHICRVADEPRQDGELVSHRFCRGFHAGALWSVV